MPSRCDRGVLPHRHPKRNVLPWPFSLYGKHLRADRGPRRVRRDRPRALPRQGTLHAVPLMLLMVLVSMSHSLCINVCVLISPLVVQYSEASDYQTHAQSARSFSQVNHACCFLGGEGRTSLLKFSPRSTPPTIPLLLASSTISLANIIVSWNCSSPCCADLHSPSESLIRHPGWLPHLF